jgi:general secretion pathway protein F
MEFNYKVLDAGGNQQKGALKVLDRDEALSSLKGRGLTVIDLVEKKDKHYRSFSFRKRISDYDIYNIFKELSILLRSGVQIDKAFNLLIHPSTKEDLKELLSHILEDLKAGKGASRSFGATGKFSPLLVTMIQVGESVGDLQAAFENVAQYYKFQIQFKSEIRNAMTYPAFLVFASVVTLFVIFNFIVPKFFSIFGSDITMLPLTARMLYSLSSLLQFEKIFFGLSLIGVFFVLRKVFPGKIKLPNISHLFIKIPIISNLILHLELSRFCYSMYSMLQSGIEFIKALKLSAGLVQNPALRKPIESTIDQIKGGKKIADVFNEITLFPDIVPNMVRVGEGSGNLKEIFFELYQIFDERFKAQVKRILILMEPAIIVTMGIVVGFIVISLIMTVMSVNRIKL